jgi:hypothetical protein
LGTPPMKVAGRPEAAGIVYDQTVLAITVVIRN